MAGKLHVSYDNYATSSNTRMAISPFGKLAKAYAEGWRGTPAQLSGDPAAQIAWSSGSSDKAGSKPFTHTTP